MLKACPSSTTVKKITNFSRNCLSGCGTDGVEVLRSWIDPVTIQASYNSKKLMQKKARIVCNPIASPFMINIRTSDEGLPNKAKAFNTNTQMKGSNSATPESSKSKQSYLVCKSEVHGTADCPDFASKTMYDKRAFIYQHHLCFGCLRIGHNARDCRRRQTCSTCGRRHPTCLHQEHLRSAEMTSNDSVATGGHVDKEVHKVMSHALSQHAFAISSIVPVFVSSPTEPGREILTYGLFETQSDSTFILEDLLRELNVGKQPVQLKLSTMTAVIIASNTTSGFKVRGFNSEVQIQQAYTCDFIPMDKSHIPVKTTALQWPHLSHLAKKLPPLQDSEVGLLIGYDCPSALAPLEVIMGGGNEPFVQRTILGWSIIGSANPHLDRRGSRTFLHRVSVKEQPVPTVMDVLKVLESDFNEKSHEDKYVSQDDVRFIHLLSDNIKQEEDGHYQMPLPFRNSPLTLPNNKRLADVRLQHLKRKLSVNKHYHDQYTAFMDEIISRGDTEPAPAVLEGETAWYIPHHGVYHPRKPNKLRVVFDCSAMFKGISLNDTLLMGPDLINSLVTSI
ncbi:uncharacterized protein LOC133509104 [Syngnathoides biaculeatus]|uniref:uncharacterized protein LOC133509104 n=1 Tax=Syngnathoides biaculeatus TaxID=300417 RepID=UPI002ADE7C11|nr:uncharacterized protein LOC133509104 [Syngnathoides biaculeatus]XP_061691813.1 uncharacterized protein LOC133509104 [Syngnathoides biaculeatus]XP_061691814.1 uncharacterized protein LOC133509104 [Syngnathoides biaculeatus]XP_061691815.1 uncharacterized protein LOC133509104 [Syngnathoides biaculeatus]XP_061691816.1 uncharacterized protein LOC133509104 [Syngnathoides biaculeatus]XP_061691817.1 uncharacterized protein LOC133509104 [Syngnathoides biaculeatus]